VQCAEGSRHGLLYSSLLFILVFLLILIIILHLQDKWGGLRGGDVVLQTCGRHITSFPPTPTRYP
jgi:hypothetical protein